VETEAVEVASEESDDDDEDDADEDNEKERFGSTTGLVFFDAKANPEKYAELLEKEKKGEITVEQGKELNKELQHNVKKTLDARKMDAKTMEERIANMGKEELETLKAIIKAAEETEEEKQETEMEEDIRKEGYMPVDEAVEAEAEEKAPEE